jgi:Asp-tRNA(Asn)/Glu-tRNA(Gln) amidotransferase A subunit family amidase
LSGAAPVWRFSTIAELAPRLATGEITAEALLGSCLAAIAADGRTGAGLGAIARLSPDAVAEARALDVERAKTGPRGPLHGIAVVLKDNIDLAGSPTTSGCLAMAAAIPAADAVVTRRLKRAGAVIIAQTHLSEFSFEIRSRSSLGGDVLNPFDRRVTAGGSSGGAAACVAAGFAVAGVGTDTGGSIRIPAAFNGLVGLRPTHGRVDLGGVAPLAPTTDTVGPLARCVADAARLIAVMTGARYRPASADADGLRGARIGVARDAFGGDDAIVAAMEQALAMMSDAGAILVDPLEPLHPLIPAGGDHIVDLEFRPAFDAYLAANFPGGGAPASLADIHASGLYLPEYRAVLLRRMAAPALDSDTYRTVLAAHARLRTGLDELFRRESLDAIAYPTSATIPTSLDNPASGWAAELAACSGRPAITLPVGQAPGGVPIGIELLGHPYGENRLLKLASEVERLIDRRFIPDPGEFATPSIDAESPSPMWGGTDGDAVRVGRRP